MPDRSSRPSVGDRLIRASAAATVVAIGAIAAVISYRHALGVAQAHGETGLNAYLTPLTIDGLVFVASMVLLDSARRRTPAPALARLALALGIGATVAVNVLHGVAHGPVGAVIAAWPAVTLVVVVELLMTTIRRGRAAGAATESATKAGREPVLSAVAIGGPEVVPAGCLPIALGEPWPLPGTVGNPTVATGALAEGPQVSGESVDGDPVTGGQEEPAVATAREQFADVLAAGAVPSVRAIRRGAACRAPAGDPYPRGAGRGRVVRTLAR